MVDTASYSIFFLDGNVLNVNNNNNINHNNKNYTND